MPYADVVAAARARRAVPRPGGYGTVGAVQGAQDDMISDDMNYDASAALNKYAQGAWGSVSAGLDKTLESLKGKAVGAGRFDSGFYDQDNGEVIRNVTNDFTNNLAQQSMNAEAQTQQVRGRGQDLLLARSEQVQNDARDEAERKRRQRSGIGSAIGGVLGGIGGSFIGMPGIGATLGASVGGSF